MEQLKAKLDENQPASLIQLADALAEVNHYQWGYRKAMCVAKYYTDRLTYADLSADFGIDFADAVRRDR